MELRILGPLEIVVDGRSIPLGGTRQRALLAYLALHPNEVVSVSRLVEAVWGAPVGGNALRTCVSRVRTLLPEGAALEHVPGGYRLMIDIDAIDAARFAEAAARGRDALARGNPKDARSAFVEALALWRGRPLADLDGESFVADAARDLTELRASIVADRIDADAALGRSGLVAELETLVAERPYDERLWAALVAALYRSGRQVEALTAYRQVQRLLAELGLEPTPELRALELAVLRHEPALGRSEVVRVRRLRLWRLALVVIASATVAGFAIFARGGRASAVRVVPNELVALDPRTGTPVAAVTVPGGPDRLVASGRLLWVTRRDGGTIVAVDPRQRTLAALADTGLAHVDAITAASGGAWAIGQDHLVRVDASLGIFVRRTMPRESTRDDNAFGSVGTAATASGRVWLATSHGIVIIDAGTGRTLRRIMSGFDATAIAAAAGRVWAVSGSQARVAELDDRTGRPLLDLRLTGVLGVRAPYPYAIAASGRVAWVLNGNTATLSMIDGDLGEVMSTTSIGVGSNPVGLAADARAAWVATSSEGAIIRVDAHTGVTRTFHVGFSPRGVALGDGAVWVAVQSG